MAPIGHSKAQKRDSSSHANGTTKEIISRVSGSSKDPILNSSKRPKM
jgi:hypothetical protein